MGFFPPNIRVINASGFFGLPVAAARSAISTALTFALGGVGPFANPPNNANTYVAAYGETVPSGVNAGVIAPDPFFVNGRRLAVLGNVQDTILATSFFVVALAGNVPQNFFKSVEVRHAAPFIDQTLLAVGDGLFNGFNTQFASAGFSVWTWTFLQTQNDNRWTATFLW